MSRSPESSRYDAIVVGGGHNGLAAAAYLARAGRSVVVLERAPAVGGAAVSAPVFTGIDARLSKYAYLVSLLPELIVDELGLDVELRQRRISSYTPVGDSGVLVDHGDAATTDRSLGNDASAWHELHAMTKGVAERVFPTLTEPLLSRDEFRRVVGDEEAWRALFERPLGELLEARFRSDAVRGAVLTDGLIGTFAPAGDPRLLANRCFLYHVIGRGHGRWDVPVGGMGRVSEQLAAAAGRHGAVVETGTEVTAVAPGEGDVTVRAADGRAFVARHVLAGVAPAVLARLVGRRRGGGTGSGPGPEGAQLKVNLLLARLPGLRDNDVTPEQAFAGTFHVNEGYVQLEEAYRQATAGRIPDRPPCEAYCHSLTDPTILGPDLRAAGAQTLTVFALHLPARLFRADPDGARRRALDATLASLDSVLAEPITDCLLRPSTIEAMSPLDVEAALGMPGGHIFHGDLQWPFAEDAGDVGRWGVETPYPGVLLCGAGARRGGGVSAIPGRNAAMAALAAG